MLLSPVLRKITTALLVLPAGVIATSSYADCQSSARDVDVTEAEWSVVVRPEPLEAPVEARASARRADERLSRRDFYGEETATAVIDRSADRQGR